MLDVSAELDVGAIRIPGGCTSPLAELAYLPKRRRGNLGVIDAVDKDAVIMRFSYIELLNLERTIQHPKFPTQLHANGGGSVESCK